MKKEFKIPAIYLRDYLRPIAAKHGLKLNRWEGIVEAVKIAARLN